MTLTNDRYVWKVLKNNKSDLSFQEKAVLKNLFVSKARNKAKASYIILYYSYALHSMNKGSEEARSGGVCNVKFSA